MSSALVSLCSPCYNVAPHIGRYLESLIQQTYKKLEIILVNDGSTDNTEEVILSYIPRLEACGYVVKYFSQRNGGQSSALNAALKHVSGKYVCWPDSDDYLTSDSVEKRLEFMEAHPEVALVRGTLDVVSSKTGRTVLRYEMPCDGPQPVANALENCIFVTGKWYFAALSYMLRTSVLDEVLPGREIYVNPRAGQNWQMLIPVLARYDIWHLPVDIGVYVLRDDSHSRGMQKTLSNRLRYLMVSEDVLLHCLKYLPQNLQGEYRQRIIEKYDSLLKKEFDFEVAKHRNLPAAREQIKNYKRLRKKYWWCKVALCWSFGKRRAAVLAEKKELKTQLRNIRQGLQ